MNAHYSAVQPLSVGALSALPGAGWQVTIVDGCCYGRMGMEAALRSHPDVARLIAVDVLAGPSSLLAACPATDSLSPSCLVLRLPMTAQTALATLLQMGELSVARYSRVVVMSHVMPDILCRVLVSVGVSCVVRLVDARCTPSTLCQAIVSPVWGDGVVLPGESRFLLSQRERRVLGRTLCEMSIYAQARQAQVSAKTIYTQRACALQKLGVPDMLTLLRQFASVRREGAIGCDVIGRVW